MNAKLRSRLGWIVAVVSYLGATYWVFTRSAPIIASRPITIRFAHWQIEKGPPEGLEAVIKRYEQLNPRVKVEQVLVPGGGPIYRQWMRSNLIGGTGVDMLEYGWWLDGLSDLPARYFAPITNEMLLPNPYNRGTPLEKVPWAETFTDGLISQQVNAPVPGQFYAATISEVSTRLFCNLDLLKEVTGSTAMPQTFDELRQLGEKVRAFAARTGRSVYMMAGARENAEWMMHFLMQGAMMELSMRNDRHGTLSLNNWDELGHYLEGRWTYDSPEARAGLELIRDVCLNMKPGFLQSMRDAATQEYLRGDSVFIFAGTWDGTSLRQLATFPVAVIRFPQPTRDDPAVGKYFYGAFADGGGGTCFELYLNKQSRHPKEAIDFLRFASSIEGNQIFTDHSGWLPATRYVKVPDAIKPYETPKDCYTMGMPYTVIGSAVMSNIDQNLYHLAGPGGSVDKFVAAMEAVMPKAARSDLAKEIGNRYLSVRPQDVQIIALDQVSQRDAKDSNAPVARERLESSQTQTEALLLQMKLQLAKAGQR